MHKPPAISARFGHRDIAGVSNLFETDATLARQKITLYSATKIACVNGPLDLSHKTFRQVYRKRVTAGLNCAHILERDVSVDETSFYFI